MKKIIFPALLIIGYVSLNAFVNSSAKFTVHNQQNTFFTGGAPAGKTGAPGEVNCTGCHAGTANDGSTTSGIAFSGTNSEYQPGVTYNMTLSINNGSSKNGFQVVALENAGNTNAGALIVTDATNTASVTGLGNTYINQTASGATQNSWNFDWTAPSSNIGDVTFYYSYNVTNSNGGNNGDQIYLGQLSLQPFIDPTSVHESNKSILNQSFNTFYDQNNNSIVLDYNNQQHASSALVKVYNLEGKSIQTEEYMPNAGINHSIIKIQSELTKGIYLVSLFLDNNVVTRKIAIN